MSCEHFQERRGIKIIKLMSNEKLILSIRDTEVVYSLTKHHIMQYYKNALLENTQ